LFLPKSHPELNPIERVWAMSKQYTKGYCKYTLSFTEVYNAIRIGVENIRNFYRKCHNYNYDSLLKLKSRSRKTRKLLP
jgi:transposase